MRIRRYEGHGKQLYKTSFKKIWFLTIVFKDTFYLASFSIHFRFPFFAHRKRPGTEEHKFPHVM